MTIHDYINSLVGVLAPHFAPDGIYHGRDGAMRLAREVGYGLAGYPDDEVRSAIGGLYSSLLVRFTFGHVPVDAGEWMDEMRKARGKGEGHKHADA